MGNSTGTFILAAVIAVLFFLASPGVIWAFPDNNIVRDITPPETMQQANRVNVMVHAAAFGLGMAFLFPILQATIAKI
jgi:hypothetical protein